MTYLPYRNDIETPEEGEQESIDGIIKGMTQETQTVEKRQGHAVRASHAKSTACVLGTLTVADGLPAELAQGLFASAGTYDVAVRFAQGPGENLGDRVSTHRGSVALSATPLPFSSWTMSCRSFIDRASRSMRVTTSVSPERRKSSRICSSVREPRSVPDFFSDRMVWHPAALSAATWMERSCSVVETRAYPKSDIVAPICSVSF